MNLRGVVLAGGSGTRMRPLSDAVNKHLLPIGPEPMIYGPIKKLVEAYIEEILVVTGTEHMGAMVQALGSGKRFGCNLTYRVQDEPGGIAQALGLAEGFADGGNVAVVLADNVFEAPLRPYAGKFREQRASAITRGARVLLYEAPDPSRFGVAHLKDGRIIRVEEKPRNPPVKSLIVTGIYFYDAQVWDMIRILAPSGRGELEITDVNNFYAGNKELLHDVLLGYWTDAGTPETYRRANELSWQTK